MDSAIIDLVSSDEEDEDILPVAPRQSQAKKPPSRRLSKPVTPEDRKNPALFSPATEDRNRKHKSKKPRQLSFSSPKAAKNGSCIFDDSDSSDDDLYVPVRLSKKPPVTKNAGVPSTKVALAKAKENLQPAKQDAQPSSPSKKQRRRTETAPKPVFNPYAKASSDKPLASAHVQDSDDRSTSLPLLSYPNPSAQKHEDIRAKLILAFWNHARTLVHASYNLNKMDQMCRRITNLALSEHPIRSVEEYCHRFTHTADATGLQDVLKGMNRNNSNNSAVKDGKYFAIAEAALAAMLEQSELEYLTNHDSTDGLEAMLKERDYWISLANLIPMIDNHLKPMCPAKLSRREDEDNGAAHYLLPSTRSAEFKQLEKLQCKATRDESSYIKAHRQEGRVYYELTQRGYQTAITLRSRTFPCSKGHYRTSNLQYVEPKFEGICLAVDNREGGGPKRQLHPMCNKLDTLRIPYFVRSLDIGDYCFFTNDNNNHNSDQLLPVLVERKSIEDVAASIFDKRWIKQKQRMYHGQFVFGYNNCRMAYIIEGNKASQELTGGFVGDRRYNVTRKQLDDEIENLQAEGFEVLRTLSRDHSMVELSKWATKIRQDYLSGQLTPQYTYEEFLRQVGKIPRSTDFSRMAKHHAAASNNTPKSPEVGAFKIHKQPAASKVKKSTAPLKLAFDSVATKKGGNFDGFKLQELKAKCEEFGLPKMGKKADLIERLNGPRPPKLWLDRKKRNVGYVPSKYNTCATALLVGLWLEQKKQGNNDWKGMTKEELYPLAEGLDISKDPFSGVATGPFKYDGWSAMSDLRGGEIPLVVLKKGRFMLTTSSDVSGFPLAEAMHGWCHEHSVCSCQGLGYRCTQEV